MGVYRAARSQWCPRAMCAIFITDKTTIYFANLSLRNLWMLPQQICNAIHILHGSVSFVSHAAGKRATGGVSGALKGLRQ